MKQHNNNVYNNGKNENIPLTLNSVNKYSFRWFGYRILLKYYFRNIDNYLIDA